MIALKLRELRKNKNVSQAEVAEYLKVTREAYSMYESGKRQMNYETLDMLSEYFDVSVDRLLGRQNEHPPLTDAEVNLIKRFRNLDNRGKRSVLAVLRHEQSNGLPGNKD